ncbi:MAG: hypothetical protein JW969_15505 [Spirochaetales bacterium]|nr:hypothetical protein [Spirochaetales bacterium]
MRKAVNQFINALSGLILGLIFSVVLSFFTFDTIVINMINSGYFLILLGFVLFCGVTGSVLGLIIYNK